MLTKNNMVFDIGLHTGEDTEYYLFRGFRVVAVDANPDLIERARKYFSNYLETNQLVLLNLAVFNKDNEEIDFNISRVTDWSSLYRQISNRKSQFHKTIKVKTKRLSSLMMEFGIPYYCKIDVEGCDEMSLETLSNIDEIPKFISVETECLGEFEDITDAQALATLNRLHVLGYNQFKLIEQSTLNVLRPDYIFYTNNLVEIVLRELKYFLKYHVARSWSNRERLSKKLNFIFHFGSTGPFGEELDGKWLDYDTARKTLLFHRNSYMNLNKGLPFGFWCDWHAKLE